MNHNSPVYADDVFTLGYWDYLHRIEKEDMFYTLYQSHVENVRRL